MRLPLTYTEKQRQRNEQIILSKVHGQNYAFCFLLVLSLCMYFWNMPIFIGL